MSTSNSIVNCTDTWVLRVEPCSLDIGLFLRVKFLWVDFSDQVRDHLHALLIIRTMVSTCLLIISLLELIHCFLSALRSRLTKELSSWSIEKSLIVVLRVSVDNSSETCLSSTDWSTIIDIRLLCYIYSTRESSAILYLLIILLTGFSWTLWTAGFFKSSCLVVTSSLYKTMIEIYLKYLRNHRLGWLRLNHA